LIPCVTGFSTPLFPMIAMYSFHGSRRRDRTEEYVLWLEEMGSVYVRRRKGRIVSARHRPTAARRFQPCRATGLSGVRFTCLEAIGERRRVVMHKPLPYPALSDDLTLTQRETVMRAAFCAVQLSVMGDNR
jgi:hypothetical protein